jgi:hypothetical protein
MWWRGCLSRWRLVTQDILPRPGRAPKLDDADRVEGYAYATMTILKLGPDRYINTNRITFTESKSKDRMVVYFATAGGDYSAVVCSVKLDSDESHVLRLWLDAHSETKI